MRVFVIILQFLVLNALFKSCNYFSLLKVEDVYSVMILIVTIISCIFILNVDNLNDELSFKKVYREGWLCRSHFIGIDYDYSDENHSTI